MKSFLLSISFVLISVFHAAGNAHENLRIFFFNADDEAGIKAFRMYAVSVNENTAVILAYKGTAIAMGAKYTDGITEKIRVFNDGKELIEKAIKADPKNAEIRFLRYCVQANIPGILGYSGNMNQDFELIHNELKLQIPQNVEFWKKAVKTMLKCEKASSSHKEKLNKFDQI